MKTIKYLTLRVNNKIVIFYDWEIHTGMFTDSYFYGYVVDSLVPEQIGNEYMLIGTTISTTNLFGNKQKIIFSEDVEELELEEFKIPNWFEKLVSWLSLDQEKELI